MRRTLVAVAVGLALGGVALLAYAVDALQRPELDTVDLRFHVRGDRPAGDVAVVAIDEATFDELGKEWPYPRSLHARAIDRLAKAGARRIAYDVQFTEQSTPREDNALMDAVARAGNVVLATTEVKDSGDTNVLGGEDNLRSLHARAAYSGFATDAGGVIRRLDRSVDGLETMAVAAAPQRADFGSGRAWIDYAGPPGTIPTVSFSSLLRGKVAPDFFRGKTVVVGASVATLQDIHPTPTSNEDMPGPEIQANAISTVARGLPLRSAPFALNALLVLLLGMAGPLLGLRLSALWGAAFAVGIAAAFALGAQLAFDSGTVVLVTYPLAALALGTVGSLGVSYALERRERRRTRWLFARFVPEQVVDEVIDRAGGELRLGGVRVEASVMFCDLRGFTAFAESLPAERVIEVLNRYLAEMSGAILDHGGTLVSYMGDGIMAVFGSPIERPDHADTAVAAAREMVEVRLPRFNDWVRTEGFDQRFRMGIGLNSGPVMSGNVGSERRLEYAAIGDTTNVAARLESMTKGTPHQLMLADSTRALLAGSGGLVALGLLEVRGRETSLGVWTVPERESPQTDRVGAPTPWRATATTSPARPS